VRVESSETRTSRRREQSERVTKEPNKLTKIIHRMLERQDYYYLPFFVHNVTLLLLIRNINQPTHMYPPEIIDEMDSQELYDLEEMTLEEIHEEVYSPSRPETFLN